MRAPLMIVIPYVASVSSPSATANDAVTNYKCYQIPAHLVSVLYDLCFSYTLITSNIQWLRPL